MPESLRARWAEKEARPPLEKVRSFLRSHVADTDGWDEIRDELVMTAQHSARPLRQALEAIEATAVAAEEATAGGPEAKLAVGNQARGAGLAAVEGDDTDPD